MYNTLLFVGLAAIILEGASCAESSCRQLCSDRNNAVCSKEVACSVENTFQPVPEIGSPLPLPNSFTLKAKCHQIYDGNVTTHHVGIEMSWKIEGRKMGSEGVEGFHIMIRDSSELSTIMETDLQISPNRTMTADGTITFIYYYDGADEERGPEINPNGQYVVTLESVPVFLRIGQLWQKRKRKSIAIPKYFIEENCQNDTGTAIPPHNNDVHKWQILTTVLGIICLIVATVALAGFSWKKRQDARNADIASREHRILVLLNMDDKAQVAKQTNWTATALSRITKMGKVTVKYNRWETKKISERGIAIWLDEKVSWANKIIISSTPDDLRNENSAEVFEQALENIMPQRKSLDGDLNQVFIIHFDDKKHYSRCPFMNEDKYRKFRLDDDWPALCRTIFGCFDSEQEPLRIGRAV